MNSWTFDQRKLSDRLDMLDPKARTGFALKCARRLFPWYQQFHDETGQGKPRTIDRALDAAEGHLRGGKGPAGELKSLADECESLVPRDDEFWTDLSGFAQNAAAAAAYALRSFFSESTKNAVWAAVQAYEAADLAAANELGIDLNEDGAEQKILAHPTVQGELAAQEEDLRNLERGETEY
jgi:uncharacterized protein YjaG (DUF416 family)